MNAFSDPALILPGAVGEDELADGGVTTAKVKAGDDLIAAAPHSGHLIVDEITWSGNDGVNRAIPHGLGRKPFKIEWEATVAGRSGYTIGTRQYQDHRGVISVTDSDATNIFVSKEATYGGANELGYTYTARVYA